MTYLLLILEVTRTVEGRVESGRPSLKGSATNKFVRDIDRPTHPGSDDTPPYSQSRKDRYGR